MSGVPTTVLNLPAVTPEVNDHVMLWDTSAGITGRSTLTTLGGVVALLGSPNTFTAQQTVNAAITPYSVAMPVRAAGAGQRGGYVFIGTNSDDSTPGTIDLVCSAPSGGTSNYLWADDTGLLRIKRGFSSAWPTGANRNTDGTVVGTQSSTLDTKELRGDGPDGETALAHIAEGAAGVRRWVYKDGAFGGEEFSGVVVDYAPRYGMDRDDEHPDGKSLNLVNAIGDLLVAVNYLAGRLAALEAATA